MQIWTACQQEAEIQRAGHDCVASWTGDSIQLLRLKPGTEGRMHDVRRDENQDLALHESVGW